MTSSEPDQGGAHSRSVRRGGRKMAVLVGTVGLAALLIVRANATVLVDTYPRLDSYRVIDEQTLSVRVAVAAGGWTRITNVAESTTEVRVTVESLNWPLPLPGAHDLVLRDLTVSLAGDLAARLVVDAVGNPIPGH